MKTPVLFSAVIALSLTACGQMESPPATSQAEPAAVAATEVTTPVLKSGEQVYKEVCMVCHASGVANAPKALEPGGWTALLAEGQAVVTAHGWVGVRGMPAKGGRPDLGLEEFARATAWMARSAGGDWQDPDAKMMEEIRKEEVKRIEDLKTRS
ncbi:MAG: c-type cytochrome [Thiobacillus sp.]